MWTKSFLGMLCALTISGCVNHKSIPLEQKREQLLASGNPPAYIDGYLDGCLTGRKEGGDRKGRVKRDEVRLIGDALYARGWQEGKIECCNAVLQEAEAREEEKMRRQNKPYSSADTERVKKLEEERRAAELEFEELWEELKK